MNKDIIRRKCIFKRLTSKLFVMLKWATGSRVCFEFHKFTTNSEIRSMKKKSMIIPRRLRYTKPAGAWQPPRHAPDELQCCQVNDLSLQTKQRKECIRRHIARFQYLHGKYILHGVDFRPIIEKLTEGGTVPRTSSYIMEDDIMHLHNNDGCSSSGGSGRNTNMLKPIGTTFGTLFSMKPVSCVCQCVACLTTLDNHSTPPLPLPNQKVIGVSCFQMVMRSSLVLCNNIMQYNIIY
jgi:hypothetical protein